jgi:type VII secretion integral membrane protein EccD
MTVGTAGDLCRVTVCGPDRRVDVAVPTQVAISDLLPVLVGQLGENLADAGLRHGGWVLQRLGAPPFDPDVTVAAAGLHDGDVIHLRPRSEQIPPVAFDDLIDGVATGIRQRPGRWRPGLTRTALRAALVAVLATAAVVIALPGDAGHRAVAAALVVVVCLIGTLVAALALRDRPVGSVFAAGAVLYAGLGGLLAADPRVGVVGLRFDPPAMFAAGVAILATAALGALVTNWARPFFLAVIVADTTAAAAMALSTFGGLSIVDSAAVLMVVTTLATLVVPLLAFRLAGLRLPPLPTAPEHLQEELDPLPSEPVLAGAARADRAMSALYGGLALPGAVAMVLAGRGGGWAPSTLVGLVVVLLLLASRAMTSGWHRLAAWLPAATGAVTLAVTLAGAAPPLPRLVGVVVALPAMAAVLVLLARTLPDRRLTPYWGRIGDIAQTVTATAILPVFLAVLDVYGAARAIGG